jgi:anaphase-promoting complex subunit 8
VQDLFEDLMARDEFQLEGMQVYSHILYIREDFGALSHLAHKAVLIDKYRHETCCIIGNYYSLKQQHQKVRTEACAVLHCV